MQKDLNYLHLPSTSTIHVGKYTSPMDPLGYATHYLQISARFSYINIQGYHPVEPLFLMVRKDQAWTLVEGVIRGKLNFWGQFLEKNNRFYHVFYHKNPYLGFFDIFFRGFKSWR